MATKRKQLQEAGDIEGLNALPLVTVFEKSSSPGGVLLRVVPGTTTLMCYFLLFRVVGGSVVCYPNLMGFQSVRLRDSIYNEITEVF